MFSLVLLLLLTADLALAQLPSQRLPTTPPTFPQKKSSEKTDLLDINSASKEQLITLPGIDETLAQRIIDGRPYKKKSELKKRRIVPEKVYKQIADKIIAVQPNK
ncbi:MAG TPA: helix-hairpin-helix domain-containing protein [Nitrososphaera sp.]|nr:helix-hairpin-helix domain-containing protein [Nitrososphaera sp.]